MFDGILGNGIWGVRIRDDAVGGSGSLAQVALTVQTALGVHNIVGSAAAAAGIFFAPMGALSGSYLVNGRNRVFYDGVAFTIINARDGDDLIIAGNSNDTVAGGPGRDAVYGGNGNDLFVVANGDLANGEVYDGGDGSDVLQVAGAVVDLQLVSLSGIETLHIDPVIADTRVTLLAAQFGAGLSLSARIDAGAGSDLLEVRMCDATALSLGAALLGFSMAADRVTVQGDRSAETIFGSLVRDVIIGRRGMTG